MKNTIICAAFCGTGKSFLCNQKNINAIEIEYWKYKDEGLQKKYIKDIKKQIGKVDYIFISTDPDGLKILQKQNIDIILVYPENKLRNEYLDRFIDRDSPHDFIGAFMKYWDIWLNELKEQNYCSQIQLKSGEYLQDKLDEIEDITLKTI